MPSLDIFGEILLIEHSGGNKARPAPASLARPPVQAALPSWRRPAYTHASARRPLHFSQERDQSNT